MWLWLVVLLQNVGAGRQVRVGSFPVLTTPTSTPAPAAAPGCWRLHRATRSLWVYCRPGEWGHLHGLQWKRLLKLLLWPLNTALGLNCLHVEQMKSPYLLIRLLIPLQLQSHMIRMSDKCIEDGYLISVYQKLKMSDMVFKNGAFAG